MIGESVFFFFLFVLYVIETSQSTPQLSLKVSLVISLVSIQGANRRSCSEGLINWIYNFTTNQPDLELHTHN